MIPLVPSGSGTGTIHLYPLFGRLDGCTTRPGASDVLPPSTSPTDEPIPPEPSLRIDSSVGNLTLDFPLLDQLSTPFPHVPFSFHPCFYTVVLLRADTLLVLSYCRLSRRPPSPTRPLLRRRLLLPERPVSLRRPKVR